jgi:diguanylate cyclase (GGDEF)-like protein
VRLITRTDTTLVVGLVAGTIVVFQQPLRYVWDAAREAQLRYHVDLVPALVILAGVLMFNEYNKRQQEKAVAAVSAAEALQARQRSLELERLMSFSLALANALDGATLQQALWRHLPAFAGERECWLLARRGDRWDVLLQDTTAALKPPVEDLEMLASGALAPEGLENARLAGVVKEATVCFPMVAGGVAVAVLGIRDEGSLTIEQRKGLGAAAALIAIAVRNVQLFLETRELSLRDNLTGCFNRGHGLETLDRELRRARRVRRPLSIVMFDIDHFKRINDGLGHLRGDDLLRATGAQLTRVLRTTDIRCRYGGDEFLIILPDTPLAGARHVAESLRREIATLAMVHDGNTVSVTASLGIATSAHTDLGVTGLIERADHAMYEAKRGGRNRWCAEDVPAAAVRT